MQVPSDLFQIGLTSKLVYSLKLRGAFIFSLLYSPLNPIYFNLIISPRVILQLRRACPIEVGRACLRLCRSHLQPPAECYNLQIKDITHGIDPGSALGDNIGRNVIISRRYRHRDKLATNLTDIWSSFRPAQPGVPFFLTEIKLEQVPAKNYEARFWLKSSLRFILMATLRS